MSLRTRLEALVTRIGAEFKAVRAEMAALPDPTLQEVLTAGSTAQTSVTLSSFGNTLIANPWSLGFKIYSSNRTVYLSTPASLAGNRNVFLPDKNGTMALVEDIPNTPGVLVLAPGATVPGGTPAGTIILRTS